MPQPSRPHGLAWQRPVLRDDGDRHRPVGWVELFFDLVFVVIIAVLAHGLQVHLTPDGIRSFVLLFLGVFWVWNGFTFYTERFESFGLENRLFAFLAIVLVAGLAIWGDDGLGHNYAGFAACYLLARGLNIALWLRAAVHEPRFRSAALGFTAGFAIAVALIGISFVVGDGWRQLLWALAVLAEVLAPAVTGRFQLGLPQISRDKFPERFGLLTMIVLGETVAGVIRGVVDVNAAGALTAVTAAEGALGLAIGFGMWWIYFDFVARRPTRPSFYGALGWVYLHVAALAAIVAVGVAIAEVIADGASSSAARALLFGGLGAMLALIGALEFTLDRAPDEPSHPYLSPAIKIVVGAVLGTFAALGVGTPTAAALAICVCGLAVPAVYGAVVWFRDR